jgi:hypothetical protein
MICAVTQCSSYEPPEFDEQEYLEEQREIRSSKRQEMLDPIYSDLGSDYFKYFKSYFGKKYCIHAYINMLKSQFLKGEI